MGTSAGANADWGYVRSRDFYGVVLRARRMTDEIGISGIRSIQSPQPHGHSLGQELRKADYGLMEGYMDNFDEFWSVYPRKVAKVAAMKAFNKALKMASPAVILEGAKAYARQRAGEDANYTKHPSTWLNGGCWGDNISFAPAQSEPVSQYYFAKEGTPELDAWDAYWRKTKGINAPRHRSGGWWFETRWPPAAGSVERDSSAAVSVDASEGASSQQQEVAQ